MITLFQDIKLFKDVKKIYDLGGIRTYDFGSCEQRFNRKTHKGL